jgi:hypothetical protein
MQRVLSVDSVSATLMRTNPPSLFVRADGTVPTTGWTNPHLGAWFYIAPPEDRIQDFDFYADEPSGLVLTVLTPISASHLINRDPAHYWGNDDALRGIRVHSKTNALEALLGEAGGDLLALGGELTWSPQALAGGGDTPFPLKEARRLIPGSCLDELIGKKVRVYRTGDAITRDLILDRLNLELDPGTLRVVDVWFG